MLEQKIHIKSATLSDAKEISELSKDEIEIGLGWNYTEQRIARIIQDKSKNVIAAWLENDLVGFGIMTYRQDQANLDLLAVKRDYRRKKVGTELILWLEKVAVTAGSFNVFVQLRKTNSEAFRLYEKLGFQRLDKLPGFYRGVEDGIVMAKSLRPMINATSKRGRGD
jgi:[ribosomal protein S18]-alanine N-acetyltransferase